MKPKTHNTYLSDASTPQNHLTITKNLLETHHKIGKGHSASVYAHDEASSPVIRVWKSKYGPSDDISLRWLKYSKRYGNQNPHLPVVHSLLSVGSSKDGNWVHMAKMERLHNTDEATQQEHEDAMTHLTNSSYAKDHPYAGEIMGLIDLADEDNKKHRYVGTSDLRANLTPQASNALHLIHKMVRSTPGAFGDLRPTNYMMRKGKEGPQYVFTDPVADSQTQI